MRIVAILRLDPNVPPVPGFPASTALEYSPVGWIYCEEFGAKGGEAGGVSEGVRGEGPGTIEMRFEDLSDHRTLNPAISPRFSEGRCGVVRSK
jgi:hypothetical protein